MSQIATDRIFTEGGVASHSRRTTRRVARFVGAWLLMMSFVFSLPLSAVAQGTDDSIPQDPSAATTGDPAAEEPAAPPPDTGDTEPLAAAPAGDPAGVPAAAPGAAPGTGSAPTAAAPGGGSPPSSVAPGASPPPASTSPATGALNGVSVFVTNAALQAMNWAIRALNHVSAIDVNSGDPTHWFTLNFELFKNIAVWVMVPLLLCSTIHQVAKGSLQGVVKSYLVFLPLAFMGMVVSTTIIQLLLNITDDFAAAFQGSMGTDIAAVFDRINTTMITASYSGLDLVSAPGNIGAGLVMNLILAIALFFACMAVWVVLVMRQASIYMGTLFLPLGFAMLVWPSTARHFKKMVEFLFAMIFSKVVMVAGVSIALAALGGAGAVGGTVSGGTTTTLATTATASTPSMSWVGYGQVIQAIVMFTLVAFAPSMVMKFIGNMAVGEMARSVADWSNKPSSVNQVIFVGRMFEIKDRLVKSGKAYAYKGKMEEWAATTSIQAAGLINLGIPGEEIYTLDPVTGRSVLTGVTYELSKDKIRKSGVDEGHVKKIHELSKSDNANDIAIAHGAMALGEDYMGAERTSNKDADIGAYLIKKQRYENGDEVRDSNGNVLPGEIHPIIDIVTNNGPNHLPLTKIEPALVKKFVMAAMTEHHNATGVMANKVVVHTPLDARNPNQQVERRQLRDTVQQLQQEWTDAKDPLGTRIPTAVRSGISVLVTSGRDGFQFQSNQTRVAHERPPELRQN